MIACMLSTAAFRWVNFDGRGIEFRGGNHFALREVARALEIRFRQLGVGLRGTHLRLLGRSVQLQKNVAFFHRASGFKRDLADGARQAPR